MDPTIQQVPVSDQRSNSPQKSILSKILLIAYILLTGVVAFGIIASLSVTEPAILTLLLLVLPFLVLDIIGLFIYGPFSLFLTGISTIVLISIFFYFFFTSGAFDPSKNEFIRNQLTLDTSFYVEWLIFYCLNLVFGLTVYEVVRGLVSKILKRSLKIWQSFIVIFLILLLPFVLLTTNLITGLKNYSSYKQEVTKIKNEASLANFTQLTPEQAKEHLKTSIIFHGVKKANEKQSEKKKKEHNKNKTIIVPPWK